jgi:hypothetical protein
MGAKSHAGEGGWMAALPAPPLSLDEQRMVTTRAFLTNYITYMPQLGEEKLAKS